jgi:hypothetical protein
VRGRGKNWFRTEEHDRRRQRRASAPAAHLAEACELADDVEAGECAVAEEIECEHGPRLGLGSRGEEQACAMARPRPADAPVMTTTFPAGTGVIEGWRFATDDMDACLLFSERRNRGVEMCREANMFVR